MMSDIAKIDQQMHRASASFMREYGFRGSLSVYLLELLATGGLTHLQMVSVSGRDKADVSRDCAVLKNAGLVFKDNWNKYRLPVRLTDEGKELAAALNEYMSGIMGKAQEGLNEDELNVLSGALRKVARNLEAVEDDDLSKNDE